MVEKLKGWKGGWGQPVPLSAVCAACFAVAAMPASGWNVPSWDARLTAPGALKNGSFHVQGMCVTSNALYFAMYDQLLKTDWMGRTVKSIPVPKHTGDICIWNGRIYAACCVDRASTALEKGSIRVYDEELNLLQERKFRRPADGIACIDGVLYAGLGPGGTKDAPYRGAWYGKFDAETLEPLCEPLRIDHGLDCCAGVQNIATDGRRLYVNVYTPDEAARTPNLIVFDRDFRILSTHRFGYCQGLDVVPGGSGEAVRFIYLTTVNWMNQPKSGDWPPVQALWQFAELKDGVFSDLTRHCIYRKPWNRDAAPAQTSSLTGRTVKNPIAYATGEKIVFTLDADGGKRIRWTRTGDDGRVEKGEASAPGSVDVATSLDRPGFVRLVAELVDGDGAILARFDGGAGVDVGEIRPDAPKPADFDSFWTQRRAELSKTPMDGAVCRPVESGRADVALYMLSIPCTGPRPATGFLSVPARPGKYPARIRFHGYNESWSAAARTRPPPEALRNDALVFDLSAHGFEFERDDTYYAEFRAACGSNGYDCAFDPVQNSNPGKAYFSGMSFRVMRALDYLKTRPEWDGRNLAAEGSSQGALQAIWAAALDRDVTECRISVPWCCNIAGPERGRAHGDWRIEWTDALGYYDAANMASRIPRTCRVRVLRAGLGDYICPPSGVMAFYNNLACPKEIVFMQGSTHFRTPPGALQTATLRGGVWRVAPGSGDDTAALQKAFDGCFLAGGGTVEVEKGEYAVKGLRLRSGTTLFLKSGAVLKASRDCGDYDILAADGVEPVSADDFAPGVVWASPRKRKTNDHILKRASRWNNAVIRILGARNVAVIGEPGSAIDGCDSYDPAGEEHFRGVHGISVHDSTNCVFKGYTIRNAGNWAHNVWRSADLRFERLTVLGGHDGIHFSTCDRVKIESCTLKTGDDCISGFDNEDVEVRGCLFNTACSALRFGGRRALVEDCRAWGPAEYPIRSSLPREDRVSGSRGAPGAGRRTLLSLFTYYSDFTIRVRHDPGEITVRNCGVENAERLLHYNFSGNETWQKNRPLRSIRFENVAAEGIGMSLCAYGDAGAKLSLALKDCRLSFARPQREFIRGAHISSLSLEGVSVEGVEGPCVRSWGDVAVPEAADMEGVPSVVEDAAEPFAAKPI